ncbi:hypothetical protein NDR87_00935 [Nocardia sp. CDC159]|uniref:DNA-binding protein n=1 Tax=Nocardia pulmonis TaxID=2951408 RepID=A0A9X2E1D6_9NOCA|nr:MULTISPECIES: hypothetical protein [Nocardia]MCM6772422.1 hypothetical protein [Nocardia pulmonis]MCM6784920.1 hypothetical protein [Nocardia sp. CDC159]
MNRLRIELRVLDAVDHVLGGGTVEDDLVEAKAIWPQDPQKAARRIAGMANAAGGQSILWIIGLDEAGRQVVSQPDTDPADWWARVESKFADETAPDIHILNVATDHGRVVCLAFETDRAPFVVKTDSAGAITREVPWRAGTRIRSASRREILSLFQRSAQVPELELISPMVELRDNPNRGAAGAPERILLLDCALYVEATSRVVLPRHRCTVAFTASTGDRFESRRINFISENSFQGVDESAHLGVAVRVSGLFVQGPDTVNLRTSALVTDTVDLSALSTAEWMEIDLRMPVGASVRVARLRQRLPVSQPGSSASDQILARWITPH